MGTGDLSGRTRVAVYRRDVGADVERVWENALDWEHLPWLHRRAFSRIELVASDRSGWCARVGLGPVPRGPEILLELRIDRDGGRYVARTLEGPGAGTEIWTRLFPGGARTGIEVEFLVPGVAAGDAPAVGLAFERLYARLWDEDEAMMVRRTRELARRDGPDAPAAPVALGPLASLRAGLPLVVVQGRERWRVVEVGGELVAHATRCPHWLGPLENAALEDGCVRCPWHGWRFDVRSGASADGRAARLATPPRVVVDAAGLVTLAAPERGARPAR